MDERLPRESLIPGDVLLYKGKGLLGKLIRFFDGTDVNHAGLYIDGEQVGEAIAEGVVARSRPASETTRSCSCAD